MKRAAYSSSQWLLLSAAVIPLMASGCRTGGSGWSPSSMFAWNRQPDVEAIGGPEIPTGPANKYTPNAVASVGAKSGGTDVQAGEAASAYGYTGESVSTPKSGLAATANGFSGGYSTSGSASTAGVSNAGVQDKPYEINPGIPQGTAGGSAGSLATKGSTAGGLPNPYGGSYKSSPGMTLPNASDVALPSGSGSRLGQSQAGLGGAQLALPNTAPTVSSPRGSGASVPSYPVAGPSTTPKATLPSYSTPTETPTEGENRYKTTPSTGTMPAYPSDPSSSYVPSSAYPGRTSGQAASAVTLPSAGSSTSSGTSVSTSTFTPGTTGRTTKYDFSGSTQ